MDDRRPPPSPAFPRLRYSRFQPQWHLRSTRRSILARRRRDAEKNNRDQGGIIQAGKGIRGRFHPAAFSALSLPLCGSAPLREIFPFSCTRLARVPGEAPPASPAIRLPSPASSRERTIGRCRRRCRLRSGLLGRARDASARSGSGSGSRHSRSPRIPAFPRDLPRPQRGRGERARKGTDDLPHLFAWRMFAVRAQAKPGSFRGGL